MNLYGVLGNAVINSIDLLGREQRFVGTYPVVGTGHHLVPVELWAKLGFVDHDACKCLDGATISTPNGHNYTGHGSISGYTAQVEAELRSLIDDFKKLNSIAGGQLSAADQQKLASLAVGNINNTSNAFIAEFNKTVPAGEKAVKTFLLKGGADLRKPLQETGECYVKYGKRIPYLKYVLVTFSFANVFSSQQAKGSSVFKSGLVATLDTASPIPVGINDAEDAIQKAGVEIKDAAVNWYQLQLIDATGNISLETGEPIIDIPKL